MAQQWWKAQDTFVAALEDGTEMFVAKGDLQPEGHELVKRDRAGSGLLFAPLEDAPEEAPVKAEPPAKSVPAKAEPPAKSGGAAAKAEPSAKAVAAKPVGKGSLDGHDPAGLQAVREHGPLDDGGVAAGDGVG